MKISHYMIVLSYQISCTILCRSVCFLSFSIMLENLSRTVWHTLNTSHAGCILSTTCLSAEYDNWCEDEATLTESSATMESEHGVTPWALSFLSLRWQYWLMWATSWHNMLTISLRLAVFSDAAAVSIVTEKSSLIRQLMPVQCPPDHSNWHKIVSFRWSEHCLHTTMFIVWSAERTHAHDYNLPIHAPIHQSTCPPTSYLLVTFMIKGTSQSECSLE